jgi:DNA polymerase-3 subunit delta
MTPTAPVIYLIHGDDEYAIAQFISDLEKKLGDPALAELNTTRLDGRTYNLDDLLSVAGALPFLAKRRLVILSNPTERLKSKPSQDKFLEQLMKVPPTTALVLIENRPLTDERDRRYNRLHWLEKWAEEHPDLVFTKLINTPRGPELVRWVQVQAKTSGGQITPQAAQQLIQWVGEDPRQLSQEINKLLAFVNYKRAIELDDVLAITIDTAEGDIFILVDALGNRDGRRAMGMLDRLLEEQDPLNIFAMVTRQFRLVIQLRELFENGKSSTEMAQSLKLQPFQVERMIPQAQNFSLSALEAILHHLLGLDEGTKSGKIDGKLALQMLVAEIAKADIVKIKNA